MLCLSGLELYSRWVPHNDDSFVSGAEGDGAGVIRQPKQPRRQRQRKPVSVRVFHKTRNW